MDIKVLVAAHKAYWMPDDPVYVPLQVGAALHPNLGYTRDDTGDNISRKNPNYCELTGLYWAWKNLECDYIGLCHYRRYFGRHFFAASLNKKKKAIFKRLDYERLLQEYDIILPKPNIFYKSTVRKHYAQFHHIEDLKKVEKIIAQKYPEYAESFTKIMDGNTLHTLNMFVTSKKKFDDYCCWLFDILFTLEKQIDISSYDSYQARVYGFLSERLLNVWLEKQQLKIVEVPIVFMEKVDYSKRILGFVKKIYHIITR